MDMIYSPLIICLLVLPLVATRLGYPDYESVWTLITAQSSDKSTLYFNHSFGQLPGLVEVLVTPLDGPYKGYIFKATGNGDRDDDEARDYGGVVYLYNEVSIVVTVPKKFNNYDGGYAIVTGDDLYWTGGYNYSSMNAYVKVRCWLPSNMQEPCFKVGGVTIESGSSRSPLNSRCNFTPKVVTDYPTFLEYDHGAGKIPDMVNVRTRLGTSSSSWYSDSQGTNRHISRGGYVNYGGIIYGYNNETVRVWIPSTEGPGKYIFVGNDGWGLNYGVFGLAVLEVRVWCNIENTVYTQTLTRMGPDVENEQSFLALQTAGNSSPVMDLFTNVKFEAEGGVNNGYHFNGIDGGMAQTTTSIPCSYGGFIYTYNSQRVILRRPSQSQGAAVCISNTNSDGEKTGPIYNEEISVNKWNLVSTPGQLYQNKIKFYQSDTCIDYPDIGLMRTDTKKQCIFECVKRRLCVALTFDSSTFICSMFDYFSSAIIISKTASETWIVT